MYVTALGVYELTINGEPVGDEYLAPGWTSTSPHALRRSTMAYVDGFVIVIPTKNLAMYKKMAKIGAKVWRELGALEYRECSGDDMKVKMGVPFPKLARAKPSETVIFSWIVYKSKAERNKINAKVMKDPRIAAMCDPENMPFGMDRFSYGGFKIMVEG